LNVLLPLPILIPLFAAILCLLGWRSRQLQRAVALAGAVSLLAAALALLASVRRAGIQAVAVGSWPPPYGIVLVADLFSALMVWVAAVIGVATVVYSLATVDPARESYGYYPLVHVLLAGVCGAFLTGDVFNLYVWFEVMLIASFVLMALGGERMQMEGAIKYVTLNLVSSAIFLAAVGLLYGLAGTLNMADLAVKLRPAQGDGLVVTVSLLFMAAFGIKAAVFPLFFWLPASYHVPPVAVSALFAGLLTKVGVYALVRLFSLVFVQEVGFTHTLLLVVAGLTMLSGVLGAAAQKEFRRILSFHIVSQIGYMVMGLALFTPLAVAGAVFYIIHHIIVKTNLFLIAGLVSRVGGSEALSLVGGLYRWRAGLAALFLIPALSLAGVPPLSGFFAKLILVRAGLETGQYAIVAAALLVSLLTLYSMTKIWHEAFWKPAPAAGGSAPPPSGPGYGIAAGTAAALAALTVSFGLGAELLLRLSMEAAGQLLEPSAYLAAVLGGDR
jgi:multicomponent Na+:H+ antiporter subunit D